MITTERITYKVDVELAKRFVRNAKRIAANRKLQQRNAVLRLYGRPEMAHAIADVERCLLADNRDTHWLDLLMEEVHALEHDYTRPQQDHLYTGDIRALADRTSWNVALLVFLVRDAYLDWVIYS